MKLIRMVLAELISIKKELQAIRKDLEQIEQGIKTDKEKSIEHIRKYQMMTGTPIR